MTSIPFWSAFVLLSTMGWAQENEQSVRNLWDTTFLKQRPPAKNSRPAPSAPAGVSFPSAGSDAFIGLTVWRLRESRGTDDQRVRLFVHGGGRDEEWTPERIQADAELREGQKTRFSIETTRSGYLYVIDREEYSDGSLGEPSLIFPTRRLRGGNNRVAPGTLVDIPGWDDDPQFLTLRRNRGDHVGEALTLLVTPQPLSAPEIPEDAIKLPAQQVASWEQRWRAETKLLEALDEVGRQLTATEKEAGSSGQKLTSADPRPQTLYRVDARAGDPLLVTVRLRFR